MGDSVMAHISSRNAEDEPIDDDLEDYPRDALNDDLPWWADRMEEE